MPSLSSLLSIFLIPLLAVGPAWTQTPVPAAVSQDAIQIRPLNLQSKEIAVLVIDANNVPVQNAAVVFHLPEDGSAGRFADGSLAVVAYTDNSGRSVSSEIKGAGSAPVPIRVTAAKDSSHAGALYNHQQASPAVATIAAPIPQPIAQLPSAVSVADRAPSIEEVAVPKISVQNLSGKTHSAAPGRLPADSEVVSRNIPADDDDPNANVPLRHSFSSASSGEAPGVSITSSSMAPSGGHSKAKWLTIAAIAAGAGVALAFARPGGGGSAAGVSIGAPAVNVGHP